ncbi:hypothetical protein JCM10908_005966 [Rhodotorula pacifica]|uniref:uncharacterized protein n=1 Tax=Rhodotorula pacifica TaxID=1495444 RepID=UPI0031809C87
MSSLAVAIAAPTSRIPRTQSQSRTNTRSVAKDSADADENAPPAASRPASRTATTSGRKALPPPPPGPRVAFAPIAATADINTTDKMPDSPPRKMRSARAGSSAVKEIMAPQQKASKLPRARAASSATTSSALAVPSSSASANTSTSTSTFKRRSPIPPGPSHAPHVLAARRQRGSVSPLPPPAAPPAATTKSKTRSKKVRPRPSELLPLPVGTPSPSPGEAEGEQEEEDELLLLPPEMTRGRGEGKVRHYNHHHHYSQPSAGRRSSSYQPSGNDEIATADRLPLSQGSNQSIKSEGSSFLFDLAAAAPSPPPSQTTTTTAQVPRTVEMSFSVTAPSSDAGGDHAFAEQENDQDFTAASAWENNDDDGDMGGFDGHDDFQYQFEPQQQEEQLVDPDSLAPVPSVSIGEDHADSERQEHHLVAQPAEAGDAAPEATMEEGGETQFGDLEEASSGSEVGGDDGEDEPLELYRAAVEVEQDEVLVQSGTEDAKPAERGQEEEDGGEAAPAEQLSPEHEYERCSSVSGSEGVAEDATHHSNDSDDDDAMQHNLSATFDFPPHSARQTRPSYPPLSPNRTGEFDEIVPVRMGSRSPEPEPSVVAEEAVSDEKKSQAVCGNGPPVEADEPDLFAPEQNLPPTASPRLREEEEDDKPIASTSRATPSGTTFPLHGTPSVVPAFLRPSSFFPSARSPSPAVLPSPRPLPSPASRPTLQFASPRLPRDRYPSSALSPNTTAAAPESCSPAKSWTRGPAFFRSSSFSPPAHAALPRTATLFERHPGGREARLRKMEEGEQSREYYHATTTGWKGLETSSPAPEEEEEGEEEDDAVEVGSPVNGGEVDATHGEEAASDRGAHEQHDIEDDDEEDEEEDEIILVGQEQQALERAKSRSLSPASAVSEASLSQEQAPPTPPKAVVTEQNSTGSASSSDGGGYRSPARSISGDIRMGSPSPRQSNSSDRSLPGATPQRDAPGSPNSDCRMASPSPARSEHVRAQGSPLRARLGELVEGSRSRIQGMLFGSPSKRPSPPPATVDTAGELALEEDVEQDDPEQPFANQPALAQGPASVADTTLTQQSQSYSATSFSSNTSRRSRRRSRPSHPTLPVIEISSVDAHAAARAAAILKVYHKYVEQGVETVDLEQLVAAEQAGAAFDASVNSSRDRRRSCAAHDDDDETEEEEELRTLLHDAEEEVRELVTRQSSAPAEAILSGLTSIPAPRPSVSVDGFAASTSGTSAPWTSREWRRLEQALVEVGRRRLRATSAISGASTSMSMTSEAIAVASVTGEGVEPDEVIDAFMRKWSIPESALCDGWSWDKLVIRVEALQARRAKDAQSKRASSVRSQHAEPSLPASSHRVPSAGSDDAGDNSSDEGAEVDENSLVKLEGSDGADEEVLTPREERSAEVTSSSDEENDRNDAEADETFFAPERRYRRRRSSIEPVHQPTALANPALRHLYEATPAPEKPQLPLKGIARPLPPAPESDDEDAEENEEASLSASSEGRSQHTPEPRDGAGSDVGKSPSSAQRLLSYLGSFVRRSPAASPSSTRAAPRSSDTPSPEVSEEPEMQQVPRGLAATSAAPIAKPLPPISDRKILPLPPSHVPIASTSKAPAAPADGSFDQSLAGKTTSTSFVPLAFRRRRRSSNSAGERSLVWDVVNAIEEAESSREEEEARIVDLLQNTSGSAAAGGGGGGIKRRAASGDLRSATEAQTLGQNGKGKGKAVDWRGFVEIDRELERVFDFVPTGTRALDRRVSGEKRATRR